MSVWAMSALVGFAAFGAGLLGSLTGLGGGIVIVPLLTLGFGVAIPYAVGASLIAVIATSSGSAAAYVKQGYTNIRVGMFLEIATTIGALAGAYLAGIIPTHVIAVIFAIVLILTAMQSLRPRLEHLTEVKGKLEQRMRLGSTYPTAAGLQRYEVRHVPMGFAIMFVAGILSALLGIGSGVVKVVALDHAMYLPFKVSTTTSNFMIGVTAAASAGVYLHRGYIDPTLAFPVMVGVLAGAVVGARVLGAARTQSLRLLFTGVMVVLAAEMLYKGVTGAL
jgi:uncharacterized membrane protein YfcA